MLSLVLLDFIVPVRIRFYILLICTMVMGIVTVLYIVSLINFLSRKKVSKLSLRFGSADDSEDKGKKNKLIIKGIIVALLWIVCIIVL